MKKPILFAALFLIATNSFCQWSPGYFNDEFGDTSTEKYIEYITENGSFTKEGRAVVPKSALVAKVKICRNQGEYHFPYFMCFELFENGGSKAINSTDVYKSDVTFYAKLNDGQVLTGPVIAEHRDLRAPLFMVDSMLIVSLYHEKAPIRFIIKIDSEHTIARYNFTVDPNGFSEAMNKHLALELPHPSKDSSMVVVPLVTGKFNEDSDVIDLGTLKVVIKDKPVYGVEQMPQFPGGEEELLRFIKDNLKYPAVEAQVGIEGRVTVRFVINRNGDVTDVTVIRGLDPSCDKEAVRVVKMMPRWIPGRQNGRNVPVYYTLPVVYKMKK